ncbi:MAG TPA: cupin domain-containing protein [Lentimicrobium sp.]|jgi:quercetin dioxygenase-like cupin family protein|nr:cupin domain-containing protein [Lentimicrobium sp.]
MESTKFMTGKSFKFENEINYSEGGIVSMRVIEQQSGNVSLFAFDKGQKLSEHTAPFDAMVMVVEGTAEIVIGGSPNVLTTGMTIIMPAGIPHAVNALEQFKMVLTMIKK